MILGIAVRYLSLTKREHNMTMCRYRHRSQIFALGHPLKWLQILLHKEIPVSTIWTAGVLVVVNGSQKAARVLV